MKIFDLKNIKNHHSLVKKYNFNSKLIFRHQNIKNHQIKAQESSIYIKIQFS